MLHKNSKYFPNPIIKKNEQNILYILGFQHGFELKKPLEVYDMYSKRYL